ncbi:MAG: GntR family transcriptional regulator [Synergistales bacterium]
MAENRNAEEKAYEAIIAAIIEGKLLPGFPITESELSEELGVSRTPIRNALRRLVAEGLLESRKNRGCVIPGLSRKDLEDLFKVRLITEPNIAFEAAKKATEDQHPYFLDLLEKERECYFHGDSSVYKVNQDLHYGIARLTGNRYMEEVIRHYYWRSELYVLFFDSFFVETDKVKLLRDPDRSESHIGHQKLVRAIFGNQPNEAKKLMEDHILSTLSMLNYHSRLLKEYRGVDLMKE